MKTYRVYYDNTYTDVRADSYLFTDRGLLIFKDASLNMTQAFKDWVRVLRLS